MEYKSIDDPSAEGSQTVVTQQIREERLPLFTQVGEQTGYKVHVLAQAGGTYVLHRKKIVYSGESKSVSDQWEDAIIEVDKGYVGVAIINPDPSRDHAPFWDALQALNPSAIRYY